MAGPNLLDWAGIDTTGDPDGVGGGFNDGDTHLSATNKINTFNAGVADRIGCMLAIVGDEIPDGTVFLFGGTQYQNNTGAAWTIPATWPATPVPDVDESIDIGRKFSPALPAPGQARLVAALPRQNSVGSGWYGVGKVGEPGANTHTTMNAETDYTVNAGGDLELDYTFTAQSVGAFIVAPDESFAGLGVTPGASIQDDKATISAYQTLNCGVNMGSGGLAPSTFFAGTVTQVLAAGVRAVTHPSVGSVSVTPTVTTLGELTGISLDTKVIVGSITATNFSVGTYAPYAVRVFYDGTNFQVQSTMQDPPTASFAGNILTVSFGSPIAVPYLLPAITLADSPTIATAGRFGINTNEVQVAFRNYTGAVITAPNADMDIYIHLPFDVLQAAPSGTALLSRENAKLDLNNVSGPGANFVGIGLHVDEV